MDNISETAMEDSPVTLRLQNFQAAENEPTEKDNWISDCRFQTKKSLDYSMTEKYLNYSIT